MVMVAPVVGGTLDREHTIVGAHHLAGQLQRARMESLKRSVAVAVRLELIGERAAVRLYVDGNGNGVLQRDIDRGTDPPLAGVEWLDAHARDVSLRINQPVTDAGGSGSLEPGSDPLRIGRTALVTFSPFGQLQQRHAVCGGAARSANGDSSLRSVRSRPRVDVRRAVGAMAALAAAERRRDHRIEPAKRRGSPMRYPAGPVGAAAEHLPLRSAGRIGHAIKARRAHRVAARRPRREAHHSRAARAMLRGRSRAAALSGRHRVRRVGGLERSECGR